MTTFLGGLFLASACQSANTPVAFSDSSPVATAGTASATRSSPAVTESSKYSDFMPIFIEATRRTTMSGSTGEQPPLQVGVAEFRFSPDMRVLWVAPSILEPSLEADVLIGVSTILLTPAQSYENRELVRFPAGQPADLRILTFDPETGEVRLSYQGETHDLPQGKSVKFQQLGGTAGAPTVITIIMNHGRLAAIQPATPDGAAR